MIQEFQNLRMCARRSKKYIIEFILPTDSLWDTKNPLYSIGYRVRVFIIYCHSPKPASALNARSPPMVILLLLCGATAPVVD